MKTFNACLLCIFLMTMHSFAQSNDEQAIRRLEQQWTALLENGDTASLLKIWSKSYVVNNTNGEIVTPEKIIALMRNGHKFPKVERQIEKITFHENIAIVMGKELQQPAFQNNNHNEWIPRRFTNIWIKSEKDWLLIARQSSEWIKK